MFSDIGADPHSVKQSQLAPAQLESLLAAFVDAVSPNSDTLSAAVTSSIMQTYPFAGDSRVPGLLQKLRVIEGEIE